jgi:hypothetical protein
MTCFRCSPFRLLVAIVLLSLSSVAVADMYKCVKDGKASYQDSPCEGASPEKKLKGPGNPTGTMAGCYEFVYGGTTVKYQAKTTSNGGIVVYQSGVSEPFPMEQSGATALAALSKEVRMQLSDGISMKVDDIGTGQKYLGIYKGTLADGKEVIMSYVMDSAQYGKRITCPAGPQDLRVK